MLFQSLLTCPQTITTVASNNKISNANFVLYLNKIIQYVLFCAWPFYPQNYVCQILSLLYVVVDHPLSFLSNIPLNEYTIYFIYSTNNGYLSSTELGATLICAAISILVPVFRKTYVCISVGYILISRIVGL